MKFKSVTIELNDGKDMTIPWDEAENIFKAMNRIKEAAERKRKEPVEPTRIAPDPSQWPYQGGLRGSSGNTSGTCYGPMPTIIRTDLYDGN